MDLTHFLIKKCYLLQRVIEYPQINFLNQDIQYIYLKSLDIIFMKMNL